MGRGKLRIAPYTYVVCVFSLVERAWGDAKFGAGVSLRVGMTVCDILLAALELQIEIITMDL